MSVLLSSFFVGEMRDDIIECELVRWGSVEGNNERFIGQGKAEGEGKDNVFVRDIYADFLQLLH